MESILLFIIGSLVLLSVFAMIMLYGNNHNKQTMIREAKERAKKRAKDRVKASPADFSETKWLDDMDLNDFQNSVIVDRLDSELSDDQLQIISKILDGKDCLPNHKENTTVYIKGTTCAQGTFYGNAASKANAFRNSELPL